MLNPATNAGSTQLVSGAIAVPASPLLIQSIISCTRACANAAAVASPPVPDVT